jgi:hypothetical protein
VKTAFVVLVAVVVLNGCGGMSAGSSSAGAATTYPAPSKVYSNPLDQFSITYYPSKMTESRMPAFELGDFVTFSDKDPKDKPFPWSMLGGSTPLSGTLPEAGSLTVSAQQGSAYYDSWSTASLSQIEKGMASLVLITGTKPKGWSAQVKPVVFNGLHGYEGSFSWDLGSNVTYVLLQKPYRYILSLTVAKAAQASSRQALEATLDSFRITTNTSKPASYGGSSNWVGIAVIGGNHKSISASWVQPSLSPHAGQTKTQYDCWVGFGGIRNPRNEDIGTRCRYEGGKVSYYAWYDMSPKPNKRIAMIVRPGDVMTGTVTSRERGVFVLTLADLTSGHSFTTKQTDKLARRGSAEVIVQWPNKWISSNPVPTLVAFAQCLIDGQAMSEFPYQLILLHSRSGLEGVPSNLRADGASFFVKLQPGTSLG